VAAHGDQGDRDRSGSDRQRDVGELAIRRGLPRLEQLDEREINVRAPRTGIATCRNAENTFRWRRHMNTGSDSVVRR
jgi:hypothetical protein